LAFRIESNCCLLVGLFCGRVVTVQLPSTSYQDTGEDLE
jgi:hypothetical protein